MVFSELACNQMSFLYVSVIFLTFLLPSTAWALMYAANDFYL